MKMMLLMTALFVGTGMAFREISTRVKLWLAGMIVIVILIKYSSF